MMADKDRRKWDAPSHLFPPRRPIPLSVPPSIRGAGFTLLEVMIALAILAVSFAGLIGTQSSTLLINRYIRDISVASLLVRVQMNRIEHEVRKDGMRDFDTELRGDFSRDGYPQFTWTALLEKVEVEPDAIERLSQYVPADRDEAVQQLAALPAMAEMDLSSLPINPAMALQAVQFLPMLVDMLGDHVRKLTLTIEWIDGRRTRNLEVTTYLVILDSPGGGLFPGTGGGTGPGAEPGGTPGRPGGMPSAPTPSAPPTGRRPR